MYTFLCVWTSRLMYSLERCVYSIHNWTSMIFRYCIAIILWWFLVLSILPNTRYPVRFVTYSTNFSTQRKLYSEKPWFSEKFLLFLFITMNCENVSVIIICLAEFIPSGLHLISKIISSLYYPRKDLVNTSLMVLGNVNICIGCY